MRVKDLLKEWGDSEPLLFSKCTTSTFSTFTHLDKLLISLCKYLESSQVRLTILGDSFGRSISKVALGEIFNENYNSDWSKDSWIRNYLPQPAPSLPSAVTPFAIMPCRRKSLKIYAKTHRTCALECNLNQTTERQVFWFLPASHSGKSHSFVTVVVYDMKKMRRKFFG